MFVSKEREREFSLVQYIMISGLADSWYICSDEKWLYLFLHSVVMH